MDKGLEKINILKKNLESLNEELIRTDDLRMEKCSEKNKLKTDGCLLENSLDVLNEKKSKIEYKSKNIKKWRNKTIIKTTLMTLITQFLLYLAFSTVPYTISYIITSLLTLVFSVLIGESNNYYFNRKYLKKNKVDDVLIKINECKNILKNTNKKQNKIDNEISVLDEKVEEIQTEIANIKTKITEIEDIRMDVINNFLESNKEIGTLLDSAYNLYEEQKNKQFIKE